MRPRTGGSLDSMFSQDEIEVAFTLLELPELIRESDSRSWSWSWPWPSFSWGVKRRRSSGGLAARQRLLGSPSKSPPPLLATPLKQNCLNGIVSSRLSADDKIDSGSPDTPLSVSFSPRECEENPKRVTRKVCGKRPREELVKEVQELTEDNKRLRTEREQLLGLYAQRKEENSALKQLEQHLLTEAGNGSSLGAQVESIRIAREAHPNYNHNHNHNQNQKALIVDQTASKVEPGGKYWSPKAYLKASEGQLREQRQLAAEARQRRMQICRVKNSKPSTKLRR